MIFESILSHFPHKKKTHLPLGGKSMYFLRFVTKINIFQFAVVKTVYSNAHPM